MFNTHKLLKSNLLSKNNHKNEDAQLKVTASCNVTDIILLFHLNP